MIKKIIRCCNDLLRKSTCVIAVLLIICGLLSLLDTFRTDVMAFSSNVICGYGTAEGPEEHPGSEQLKEANPDITAWLTLYGTNIDYPVLQGKTDMEYINKDASGSYAISGSIFLTVLNKKDYSEPYQLIYGHHMENGSMFGNIDRFISPDFFYNSGGCRYSGHEGFLITDNKLYELRVFAVLKTDAYDQMIYDVNKTEEDVGKLIGYVKKKAVCFKDEKDIRHVIALSTCDSGTSYGRTVLLCSAYESTALPEEKENKSTAVRRTARGHIPSKKNCAILNLLALVLELYLVLPVHLLKEIKAAGRYMSEAVCLLTGAVTILIFILSEDLTGIVMISDVWTPVMEVLLALTWLVRYVTYKKLIENP